MPQNALAPPSVNALDRIVQQQFGMQPNMNRLNILPRYSAQEGWVAPEMLYQAARGIAAPRASMQMELGPEEALNTAGTAMGGSILSRTPASALRSGLGLSERQLPLSDIGELTKFTKPLPAGQLYRETSSSNLMDLFKGNTPFGSPITYFSEVPEMALGQGTNKGVMIRVNSEGLRGRPFLGKPGLEQAYLQKAGEFELKEQPSNIVKAIKEIWVSPEAYKNLRKPEIVMFNRHLGDLEKSGVKVNRVDKLPNTLDVDLK